MIYLKTLLLTLILAFSISCQKNENSPESSLENFVNYRFSKNQSKSGLLERTTGAIHDKIDQMTSEEMKKFVNMAKFRKKGFSIKLKKCEKLQCFLTYMVSYDRYDDSNSKDFVVEVRKIAELANVDGSWKVVDVNNIKSHYDSRKEISP